MIGIAAGSLWAVAARHSGHGTWLERTATKCCGIQQNLVTKHFSSKVAHVPTASYTLFHELNIAHRFSL